MRSLMSPVSVILRLYFYVIRNACLPVETPFERFMIMYYDIYRFEHRQET